MTYLRLRDSDDLWLCTPVDTLVTRPDYTKATDFTDREVSLIESALELGGDKSPIKVSRFEMSRRIENDIKLLRGQLARMIALAKGLGVDMDGLS